LTPPIAALTENTEPMSAALSFPWIVRRGRSFGGRRGSVHAPRVAPSAVRIPEPALAQLPLRFSGVGPQIFVHEGARQALERRMNLAYRGVVQLAVTDNRRRMVTRTERNGVLRVRVHMMFLDAPQRVLDALIRYVVHGEPAASEVVGRYIDTNGHRIRAVRTARGPLRTRGRTHDLEAILRDVAERYLGLGVPPDVLITWGRHTHPKSGPRKTIKLGSYSATERLIRVHPTLDKDWVPRYFVSYIVYHELLHHLVPAVRDGDRALLHTAEFARREREFHHYERAMAWELKHIGRLLRSR
jgi:hypothetical protein